MSTMRRGSAVLLVGMLAACASTSDVREQPASASSVGQVGNIMLVRNTSEAGGEKVLVATFLFVAGQVQPREAIVAFGSQSMPRTDASDFRLQLVDRQGQVFAEYGILNPRKVVVERLGLVETQQSTYAARFPFNAQAREIRVLDAQGNVAARTDIGAVIREFCTRLRQDKDCALYQAGAH